VSPTGQNTTEDHPTLGTVLAVGADSAIGAVFAAMAWAAGLALMNWHAAVMLTKRLACRIRIGLADLTIARVRRANDRLREAVAEREAEVNRIRTWLSYQPGEEPGDGRPEAAPLALKTNHDTPTHVARRNSPPVASKNATGGAGQTP